MAPKKSTSTKGKSKRVSAKSRLAVVADLLVAALDDDAARKPANEMISAETKTATGDVRPPWLSWPREDIDALFDHARAQGLAVLEELRAKATPMMSSEWAGVREQTERLDAIARLQARAAETHNPAYEIAARRLAGDPAPASALPPIALHVALPVRGPDSMPELATDVLVSATRRLFELAVKHDDNLFAAAARLIEAARYATEATSERQKLATLLAKVTHEIAGAVDREILTPPLKKHRGQVRSHVLDHIELQMTIDASKPRRALARTLATIATLNGAAFAMGLKDRGIDLDKATEAVDDALACDPTPLSVLEAIARAHGKLSAMNSDKKKKGQRARLKKKRRSARGTIH